MYTKPKEGMMEFIVELLVVVEAKNRTDAEAFGEKIVQWVTKPQLPAGVLNVLVTDVRSDEDEA